MFNWKVRKQFLNMKRSCSRRLELTLNYLSLEDLMQSKILISYLTLTSYGFGWSPSVISC